MEATVNQPLLPSLLDNCLLSSVKGYCEGCTLQPNKIYLNQGELAVSGPVGFAIRDETIEREIPDILGKGFASNTIFSNLYRIQKSENDKVLVEGTDSARTPIVIYRGGSIILNFDLSQIANVHYEDSRRPLYTYIPFFNVRKIPTLARRSISNMLSSRHGCFETIEQACRHYAGLPFNKIDFVKILLNRVLHHYQAADRPVHEWPYGKKAAFVSLHDVDSGGLFRRLRNDPLLKLEESLGVKSTWFCLTTVLSRVPKSKLDYLTDRGYEIGWHGYNHDHRLPFGRYSLRAISHLNSSVLVQRNNHPLGMRTPKLLKSKHLYDCLESRCPSLCYDTSFKQGLFPYYLSSRRKILEIPTTVPTDIALYNELGNIRGVGKVDAILKIHIERTERLINAGAVVSIVTHPEWDLSLKPELLIVYRHYLAYLQRRSDIWFTTAGAMYKYWSELGRVTQKSDAEFGGGDQT